MLPYCAMLNDVHFFVAPADALGSRGALGEAHGRYSRVVNVREGWKGHLWQERFHSFMKDK